MSNYSKYKERRPEDTVFRIQTILNRARLFTTVEWMDKPLEGVCSNRVMLYPTKLGVNGKGTDEVYTLASGYAELMERMQNDLLSMRGLQPEITETSGFNRQPDERLMTPEEILAQHDPFMTELFKTLGIFSEIRKIAFLCNVSEMDSHRKDGKIAVIPFADLENRKVIWLPYELILCLYGSNGMAAGNTIEEALVQGISELFERYVNVKLLQGECIPPQIPDEALMDYSIWNLIEQIRRDDRYDVRVLDCSLGKGLPVCATMIIDRELGTFSMKLGSHPSIAVSVERSLTETFQGKDLRSAIRFSRPASLEEATKYHNIPNVVKIGYGVYPYSLLTDAPQWSYRPWTQWEGLDNRGFLRKMLELIHEMGFQPLIRDISHMGFPSCFVVVPGLSKMYPANSTTMRVLNTAIRNAEAFSHFPDLTEEEEKRFLSLICFKEGSLLENMLSNMVMRPIEGKLFSADRIGAFLALKQGDYPLALHFFGKLLEMEEDEKEQTYFRCMTQYIRCLRDGLSREQAKKLVCQLYNEEAAQRVLDETGDPATMLQKVFPRLTCFDCEKCPLAGRECQNPQEVEVFRRIRDAMKGSTVSQEEMLEKLLRLLGE